MTDCHYICLLFCMSVCLSFFLSLCQPIILNAFLLVILNEKYYNFSAESTHHRLLCKSKTIVLILLNTRAKIRAICYFSWKNTYFIMNWIKKKLIWIVNESTTLIRQLMSSPEEVQAVLSASNHWLR